MTADLSPERVDELAEAMAEHRLHASMNICTGCDWRATPDAGSLVDQHEAHRAQALAPLVARWVAEAEAEALRKAGQAFLAEHASQGGIRAVTVRRWLFDRAALTTTEEPRAVVCNCIVSWDGVNEQHVWLNGSLTGDCGHPPTGTPYATEEQR